MLMWRLSTFYYNAINYIKTQLSHCFEILKYYSAKTQKDIFSIPRSLSKKLRAVASYLRRALQELNIGNIQASACVSWPSGSLSDLRSRGCLRRGLPLSGHRARLYALSAFTGRDRPGNDMWTWTGLSFPVHPMRLFLQMNLKGCDPRNLPICCYPETEIKKAKMSEMNTGIHMLSYPCPF